ncbi:putative membrane protein [Salsuginibacillus halophilus]|uniref:Putative membrane protein n=1 Tax=Salsuginibacillus halophilus TaxID=517424 RepID=A0A2P8HWF6_9BACI|nr:PH domain-containing protein [Salsuginibacillus halophilus]PSL50561.1 putative membrane protein [Salsuginibacillus halophilus]
MNQGRRMHPAAMLILFLSRIRELLLPLVIVFFFTGGFNNYALWIFGAFFVFILVTSVWQWFVYRYDAREQELEVQQGYFIKKHRYIRRERIQSFDRTAGVLQRMFGLVKVKVETAGGGQAPEVEIVALQKDEAERIRRLLLKEGINSGDEENLEEENLQARTDEELPSFRWHLPVGWLMLMAATSSSIGIVFSALLALLSQVEQLIPMAWRETLFDQAIGVIITSSILFLAGIAVFVFLAAWIISIAMTAVKYGRFSAEKRADEILLQRGLLERRQLTLKEHRITAVRIVQNPVRQLFGFCTVYVESAGGGSEDEQQSTVLLPMAKRATVVAHLERLLPQFQFEHEQTALPQRALPRFLIRMTVLPLLILGLLAYFTPASFWLLGLSGLFALLGWRQFKDSGSASTNHYVFLQRRVLQLSLVIIPRHKVQDATASQSLLQRQMKLNTYTVSVQNTTSGRAFSVRDLDEGEASHLLAWYSYHNRLQHDNDLYLH